MGLDGADILSGGPGIDTVYEYLANFERYSSEGGEIKEAASRLAFGVIVEHATEPRASGADIAMARAIGIGGHPK